MYAGEIVEQTDVVHALPRARSTPTRAGLIGSIPVVGRPARGARRHPGQRPQPHRPARPAAGSRRAASRGSRRTSTIAHSRCIPELLPVRPGPRRPLLAVPRRRGQRHRSPRPPPAAAAGASVAASPEAGGVTVTAAAPTPATPRSGGWRRARPLVEVRNLVKHFPVQGGVLQRTIAPGPGRRRRQLRHPARRDARARRRVGLRQDDGRPAAAAAHRSDRRARSGSTARTSAGSAGPALKPYRRRMQIIFQDPYASLDPRTPIGDSIGEGLRIHGLGTSAERRAEGLEDDGHGRPAAVPRPALPARVQRWPAAAHRHRACARPRTGPGRVRRARLGARRVDPGAGAEPAEASCSASSASHTCSSPTTWASSSTSATGSR